MTAVAILLATPALASEDALSACYASLDEEVASNDGADMSEMRAGCDCMVAKAGDDAKLLQEIIDLSAMDPATRDSAMSPDLGAIAGSCFP